MQRTPTMIGVVSLVGAVLIAGPASALTAYGTAHLNVRSGPGFQYPVVGQMEYNAPVQLSGCLADYTWCNISVGLLIGWASGEYLVLHESGQSETIGVNGAKMAIPVVTPQSVATVVPAAPPVGAVVAVAPSVGLVQPIAPAPAVIDYVAHQAVEPVLVNGEVVVGATLPAAVPYYPVPQSPCVFTYVNGQKVLVEPGSNRILYIFR
jgi:uncharacterized protein YraI